MCLLYYQLKVTTNVANVRLDIEIGSTTLKSLDSTVYIAHWIVSPRAPGSSLSTKPLWYTGVYLGMTRLLNLTLSITIAI